MSGESTIEVSADAVRGVSGRRFWRWRWIAALTIASIAAGVAGVAVGATSGDPVRLLPDTLTNPPTSAGSTAFPATWPGSFLASWHPGGDLQRIASGLNAAGDKRFALRYHAETYKLALVARCDTGRITVHWPGGDTLWGRCRAGRSFPILGGGMPRTFTVAVSAAQNRPWGVAVYEAPSQPTH